MVAKINRGVSLYGAVIYNQRKVDESTARIITGNRMITDITGNPIMSCSRRYGFRQLPCRQQEHGEAGIAYLPEPIGG